MNPALQTFVRLQVRCPEKLSIFVLVYLLSCVFDVFLFGYCLFQMRQLESLLYTTVKGVCGACSMTGSSALCLTSHCIIIYLVYSVLSYCNKMHELDFVICTLLPCTPCSYSAPLFIRSDHRICVWNASDGSLVHSLTGHDQQVSNHLMLLVNIHVFGVLLLAP